MNNVVELVLEGLEVQGGECCCELCCPNAGLAVRARFLEFNVKSPLESESASHLNPLEHANIPI